MGTYVCDLLPLLEQMNVSPFTALPVRTRWGMEVLRKSRIKCDVGWKSPGQPQEQIFQIFSLPICKKPCLSVLRIHTESYKNRAGGLVQGLG